MTRPRCELESQSGEHQPTGVLDWTVLAQVAWIGLLAVDEPGQFRWRSRETPGSAVDADCLAQLVARSSTLNLGSIRRKRCSAKEYGKTEIKCESLTKGRTREKQSLVTNVNSGTLRNKLL